MIFTLIALTCLVFAAWIYLLLRIYREQKIQKGSVRGILKFYSRGELGDDLGKIIKKWLIAFIALFLVVFAWVVFFTWGSDYNFLIAIYPFVWHYMFFRYFLWEKEDLLDHPAAK